jgi:hypothetical protein
MLTIFILLILSYLLLPITKALTLEATNNWNKTWGIIFLIPGTSLVVLTVGCVVLMVGIAYACLTEAIEDNFVENYFKKEKYND